ncbi:glucosyltransferase domain-containing protein [Acetobacter sp. P1H12_c]|uniref:glucosyltransferase domain-containing protein n=1 Tax=Acetobacter sp. P1H12_c TaxID=2762621 RepID=UPI001C044950|nr:glucosyltransferase domain-containing protein [Acetobacter sp. P1H12_c]
MTRQSDQIIKKESIYNYICLFIFVFICYSSVFIRSYGLSDDYSVIYYHYTNPGWNVQWESMSGRPVYGALRQIMTWTVGKVSAFSYFRFVAVFFIASYSVLLYIYMNKKHIFESNIIRFSVASSLAFLPSLQIYASWTITYPFILSIILAFFAFTFVNKNIGKENINIIVGYLMLAISFLIYQPTGMIFVFFVFIKTFFEDGDILKKIIRNGIILFCAMLTNFIFIKIYTHLYGSTGREALNLHFFQKVLWFFNRPFMDAIANYNIHPSVFYNVVSACIILCGVWFTPKKWNFFVKILIVVAFCFASYMPNIMVAETSSPYRTLVGVESILAVLFLNGIFNICSRFISYHRYVFLFVMPCIAFSAIYNINYYIIDVQQHQLSDLAAAFKFVPRGRTIDFDIRGVDGNAYSKFNQYEYGTISINNTWTPKAMAMDIIKNNGLSDIKMTDGILVSDPGNKNIYYIKMSEIKNMGY